MTEAMTHELGIPMPADPKALRSRVRERAVRASVDPSCDGS